MPGAYPGAGDREPHLAKNPKVGGLRGEGERVGTAKARRREVDRMTPYPAVDKVCWYRMQVAGWL